MSNIKEIYILQWKYKNIWKRYFEILDNGLIRVYDKQEGKGEFKSMYMSLHDARIFWKDSNSWKRIQ